MQAVVIKEVSCLEAPINLLAIADPSLEKITAYLPRSKCFIALLESSTVGAFVLLPLSENRWELMSIAVEPVYQRKGIGSMMLRHAISRARMMRARRLEVGTGTFGYQLTYYQREGFRVFAVERDFFLEHYSQPIYEDGIQHKDMLRLAVDFCEDDTVI